MTDLQRKLIAYGLVTVLAAGLGGLWVWSLQRRALGDVTRPRACPEGEE